MSLRCQICASDCDQTFAIKSPRGGLLDVCRTCKGLSPLQQYNILYQRHEDIIARARMEFNVAFRMNDVANVKRFKKVIDEVTKSRDTLYKPEEAA